MKKLIFPIYLLLLVACQIKTPDTDTSATISTTQPSINYDSLRVVLEDIYDKDQGCRAAADTLDFSSPAASAFFKKLKEVDDANQPQVFNILDKYGCLPQSKIGKKAADGLFYVIQHSSNEKLEHYFPLFKEMAAKGEANKVNVAKMEDRILTNQGKKQIYGTQAYFRGNEGRIWPIEDPANVNKRRKEAGFELTVEENAKSLNAIYNPNDTLSSFFKK